MNYARPDGMEDALNLLADRSWVVLAGGTDFYPAQGDRPLTQPIMDISALEQLRGIREDDEYWHIGGLTTWADIAASALPPAFDALKLAAREVGSVQIQNAGTVAGNLCNASPAADGVPPLLVVDAEVELRSASGVRTLPLSEFITGNRKTARRRDELLVSVRAPKASCAGQSHFLKLGSRRYLVISIAMAAVRLQATDAATVASSGIAAGACSEVATRLPALEADIAGAALDASLPGRIGPVHFKDLSPINDIRGTADYRLEAVEELVRRAIGCCVEKL